jgi:6-methylsalicylate decarboxylase
MVRRTIRPNRVNTNHVMGLGEAGVCTDDEIASIERGNALKSIPRLTG